MSKFALLFLLILPGLIFAGCEKEGSGLTTPSAKSVSGPTDAEIPIELNDGVQVVKISANDTMHFSGNRFTVHANTPVRIELTNKGSKPAAEMAHDFVLLKPGTDATMFNLACAQAKDSGYLPVSEIGKVMIHTELVGPGQTATITFTPSTPGKYDFLCNFPGHYAAGMHGAMTVVP